MPNWSVVIWAAVTDDLEDSIHRDLDEARTALDALAAGADIHLHVFLLRPGHPEPEVASWPQRRPHAKPAKELGDALRGTQCWADGQRRRMLVLWGHGARAFPDQVTTGGNLLTRAQIEELRPQRVSVGVATAERLVANFDPRFDLQSPHVIGYDACRMATVPTVLPLADFFPDAYFVGSMVPEPASGWPYFELVQILQHEDWSVRAIASAIVESYAGSVDSYDWCMVALELAKVRGTGASGRGGLAAALRALFRTRPPGAIDFFAAAEGADVLDDTNLADLGALVRRLEPLWRAPDPLPPALRVRAALTRATVARRSAGSLRGRDGIAMRVGLPWDRDARPAAPQTGRNRRSPTPAAPPPWPGTPTWSDYLPDTVEAVDFLRP